jgi:hypothetical protein
VSGFPNHITLESNVAIQVWEGNTYISNGKNLTLTSAAIEINGDINLAAGTFVITGIPPLPPVTLGTAVASPANMTITANAGITIPGTVNSGTFGAKGLTLVSTGIVTLNGNVGTATALSQLVVNNASRIVLGNPAGSAASITTENTLDFGSIPLELVSATVSTTTLTTTVASQNITLWHIRGPGKALTLSTLGIATFAGNAGSTASFSASSANGDALGAITINPADGGITVAGTGSVNAASFTSTITGDVAINGPVPVHDASGNVFSSTGTGASTFTSSNTITATGAGDITVTHPGAVTIGGTVSATGGGNVAISSTGSTVAVNAVVSTLNTGAGTIAIDSDGLTTLAANVTGGTGAISFGTTGAGGVSTSGVRTVSTAGGNITFDKNIDLGDALTVTTNTGAGDISLSSVTGSGKNLNLTAGTGNITVSGTVGTGTDRLGDLTVSSAVDVTFAAAAINAASFIQAAGTGTTTFN